MQAGKTEVKMASCIPETMKALVKQSEGQSYDYVDVPIPKPNDGELLVRVNKVAICGSDIALYQWNAGLLILHGRGSLLYIA